jgi:ElaB/YqjD/DUF883 family membrane-anchored ribosome-binding protein
MDMASTPSNEKIQEALELLRQAAVEKKEELRGMVQDQFSDLQDLLGGIGSRVGRRARDAMENVKRMAQSGQECVKETAVRIDEHVHDKPWHYIGGVAVTALLLGYVFGRRS